mmetsp:Transcript_20719/g.60257  ORF Transcript_20719/g.60257 Transcript_20719/m.60257 type:complete len:252 (+) Transcript_20719:351-1106(+)
MTETGAVAGTIVTIPRTAEACVVADTTATRTGAGRGASAATTATPTRKISIAGAVLVTIAIPTMGRVRRTGGAAAATTATRRETPVAEGADTTVTRPMLARGMDGGSAVTVIVKVAFTSVGGGGTTATTTVRAAIAAMGSADTVTTPIEMIRIVATAVEAPTGIVGVATEGATILTRDPIPRRRVGGTNGRGRTRRRCPPGIPPGCSDRPTSGAPRRSFRVDAGPRWPGRRSCRTNRRRCTATSTGRNWTC